jgi:hypothetical protein
MERLASHRGWSWRSYHTTIPYHTIPYIEEHTYYVCTKLILQYYYCITLKGHVDPKRRNFWETRK